MEETQRERLNVFLPRSLVGALRLEIPVRRRTAFIAEAIEQGLRRRHLLQVIEKTSGAWSSRTHPELKTRKAINRWISRRRQEQKWVSPA